ncbi:MAG: hypothetical protein N3F05_02245 [Candidatus Diapherotrites archaeon]|nr:hypothetical protein [Candidatus Diapherotrites archaeon]
MNKGFVVTISVAILLSVLLIASLYYLRANQAEQKLILESASPLKVSDIASDVAEDTKSAMGFKILAEGSANSYSIKIQDSIPIKTSQSSLTSWKSFIEGPYSQKKNAKISLCNLTPTDELQFSNGIGYKRSISGNYVIFYAPNSDTNAYTYDLNLSIKGSYYNDENSIEWSCSSGSTKVTLRLKDDLGPAFESVCNASNSDYKEYIIKFKDSSGDLNIAFGSIGTSRGAIKIQNNLDKNLDINFGASINTASPIRIFWPCDLNIYMGNSKQISKITLFSG